MLLVVLAFGVGMVLAALNVQVSRREVHVALHSSALVVRDPGDLPDSIIPDRYRVFVLLNPLSGIIDTFRASLVPGRPIDWHCCGAQRS